MAQSAKSRSEMNRLMAEVMKEVANQPQYRALARKNYRGPRQELDDLQRTLKSIQPMIWKCIHLKHQAMLFKKNIVIYDISLYATLANNKGGQAYADVSASISLKDIDTCTPPPTGPIPKYGKVDFRFIRGNEKQVLHSYTIDANKHPRSGVTTSTGFDLGQFDHKELKTIFKDLTNLTNCSLYWKFLPFLEVRGKDAEIAHNLRGKPFKLTKPEADYVDQKVFAYIIGIFADKFGTSKFLALPGSIQTILADISFHRGPNFKKKGGWLTKAFQAGQSKDWKALRESIDSREDDNRRRVKQLELFDACMPEVGGDPKQKEPKKKIKPLQEESTNRPPLPPHLYHVYPNPEYWKGIKGEDLFWSGDEDDQIHWQQPNGDWYAYSLKEAQFDYFLPDPAGTGW